MGEQLISLIADLTWCRVQQRKRYPSDTPQGSDPSCDRAKDLLDRLRAAERIFVLEGVVQHDPITGLVVGVYGTEFSTTGVMEGKSLVSDIGRPVRLWGTLANNPLLPGKDYGNSCGGWW